MKTSKKIFLLSINIFIIILVLSCSKKQNKIHETQSHTQQKQTDLEINVHQSSLNKKFKKCYVTFDPDGCEGNHLFKVFIQNNTNSNYYWGFNIAREQNLSDKVYSDQYRIINCKEFIYNGKKMLPTGSTLLDSGESEFTYKRIGASNPTGGFHGREKFTEISFFTDGNLLNDITTEFEMRGCETFTYIQKSIIYRDDNVNIEDALHQKTTTISNSGYLTKNIITAKAPLPINTCFGSLVSLSTDLTAKAFANNQENVVFFNQDGNKKLEDYCDNLVVWSDKNKLSANIESVFSVYNDYATQYIWDHKFYGKYYRCFQNISLNKGESWSFETKVTFNKL